MTSTIPTNYGDLVVWTTADPQDLPTASSAMQTSVASAFDTIGGILGTTLGVWESYTPVATGLNIVNGSLQGRYTRIGNTVTLQIQYTAGSLDTFSGTFTFSLPTTSRSTQATGFPMGSSFMLDGGASSTRRSGTACKASGTTLFILVDSLASSATVTQSVPWTWASTDTLYISGTYESL